MDTIKALQIIMAALSAALIKEFYDSAKHSEATNMFIAEMLMSTMVGVIVGFIIQKYMQDIMFIMGITAASSIQGPESLNKILMAILKLKGVDIKKIEQAISDTDQEKEKEDKEKDNTGDSEDK